MADSLNRNGLSIGGFATPSSPASVGPTPGTGSTPSEVIAENQATIQNLAAIWYPSDMPKYFMNIQVCKYSRADLMTIGQTQTLWNLALPFPDRLLDNNSVAYNQVSFSSTIGNAYNAVRNQQSNPTTGSDGAKSEIPGMANPEQLGALGGAATKGLAVDASSVIPALQNVVKTAGYSPNYFYVVVLDGPQYKTHNFSWTFAPRNPKETTDLARIIRIMKNAQAPGLAWGGALFSFPRIFRISYAPDDGYLYQFKPSILVNFQVDYSGGGVPAMRRPDPSTGNQGTPAALKVSATFMELEYWLRSDFGSETNVTDTLSTQGGRFT